MVKRKRKTSILNNTENLGSAKFYCSKCNHKFEIDWKTIWDIQECTHGYVGYYLNNTFISCEKCGEICSDEASVPNTRSAEFISDDNLPF